MDGPHGRALEVVGLVAIRRLILGRLFLYRPAGFFAS